MADKQLSTMRVHDSTIRANGSVESSTTTFESTPLTAANFDAQEALWDTLVGDLGDIINGLVVATTFAGFQTCVASLNTPGASGSHRELAWLIKYHQTASPFKPGTRSIGTADDSHLTPNKEELDPTSAEYIALKASFEGYVMLDGQAVTMDRILWTGKPL